MFFYFIVFKWVEQAISVWLIFKIIIIRDRIVIRLLKIIRNRIVNWLLIVIQFLIIIWYQIVVRLLMRGQISSSTCNNNLRWNSNSTSSNNNLRSNSNTTSKLRFRKRRPYLTEKRMAVMDFRTKGSRQYLNICV